MRVAELSHQPIAYSTMFLKSAVVSIFALFFAVVLASPQPTPGPVDPVDVQRRQIDSVISQVTGGGASIISQITSGAASVATALTSNAASIGGDLTSVGASLGSGATSLGGDITSKASSAISAASSAASTRNSGTPMAMINLQTPLLAAFATIIFSTLFGAAFVL
ncbi:hypothetical protein CPB83DRAFT_841599 [Crepidotus variabilis]|uniref:Transmembrane protein n=1 Tax=Crepidotus variabilis TaxID=179855 RepID=A0A9P6JWP0_9AGAR|nr:hypothetical protein CPB83DRAFT_841599 [Crepidotus variabilis]